MQQKCKILVVKPFCLSTDELYYIADGKATYQVVVRDCFRFADTDTGCYDGITEEAA